MKVLPPQEKDRIQREKERQRRSIVAEEIDHTNRVVNRVNIIVFGTLTALLLVLSSLIFLRVFRQRQTQRERYNPATFAAFTNLTARTESLAADEKAELAKLELDLLHNYRYVEKTQNISALFEEIEKARAVLDWSREQTRSLFREVNALFPRASANERHDAQKLYGERMTSIDAQEARLRCDEYALTLLDVNRGRWKLVGGKVQFDDAEIQREFLNAQESADGDTARWHKDFGGRVIESAPVEVPNM